MVLISLHEEPFLPALEQQEETLEGTKTPRSPRGQIQEIRQWPIMKTVKIWYVMGKMLNLRYQPRAMTSQRRLDQAQPSALLWVEGERFIN
ncbi:hypothetical protein SRHO_G00163470 [Serrasalmus rhombeus]